MSTPFVVGVAGGSGAGKTALCRALAGALGPHRVSMLCHDAYYRNRSELPAAERAALNYDVPDALDTPLFVEHLRALRALGSVRPPRYCFVTHRRIGDDGLVEARPVVLVEGILLLHEPQARALLDLAFFLDVPDEEILRAEGLTEAEARDLAQPTETIPNGRGVNRRHKPRMHQK